MTMSRKARFAAAAAVALTMLGARVLNASERPGAGASRTEDPGPAAPASQRPDPVPTDYWTQERMRGARPAPMPVTDE